MRLQTSSVWRLPKSTPCQMQASHNTVGTALSGYNAPAIRGHLACAGGTASHLKLAAGQVCVEGSPLGQAPFFPPECGLHKKHA